MEHNNSKFLLIFLLIFTDVPVKTQDIHFSQYSNTSLLINPAFAGEFEGNGRFMLNYRDQWHGVTTNPYKSFAFAFDRNFFKEALSAGITAMKDQAGDGNMGITQINLIIATRVAIGQEDYLKLGINSAWSKQSVQFSNLTWNSQYDGQKINPSINSGEVFSDKDINYIDFSSGILWTHIYQKETRLNVGLSAFHITQPYCSFLSTDYKLKIRWSGHVDLTIPLPEKRITLYPSMLMMVMGPYKELCVGSILRYKFNISSIYTGYYKATYGYVGAFYRHRDAIILYAGIQYRDQFKFGLSYDINVSRLVVASHAKGGLEISLSYVIPVKALIKLE